MNIVTEQLDGAILGHLRVEALDASNVKEFKTKAATLMAPGNKVIFELSDLRFIDSSGLGALLSCLRQLNATGGSLKLCSLAKPVRALFELVRMHRVFEIFNTEEEAIRSCRGEVLNSAAVSD
jgi:anti-sigma B factor antagonist